MTLRNIMRLIKGRKPVYRVKAICLPVTRLDWADRGFKVWSSKYTESMGYGWILPKDSQWSIWEAKRVNISVYPSQTIL